MGRQCSTPSPCYCHIRPSAPPHAALPRGGRCPAPASPDCAKSSHICGAPRWASLTTCCSARFDSQNAGPYLVLIYSFKYLIDAIAAHPPSSFRYGCTRSSGAAFLPFSLSQALACLRLLPMLMSVGTRPRLIHCHSCQACSCWVLHRPPSRQACMRQPGLPSTI